MTSIARVVKKHIKGSLKKTQVKELTVLVCNITNIVKKYFGFPTNRVYITTKSLKHMYDKRNAQEFDFLIGNLPKIIKYPSKVYKNKDNKTGGFCFSKELNGDFYFCIIETNEDVNPEDGELGMNYVVSSYRLNEDTKKRGRYLQAYELLWSWKGDIPSS